MKIVQTLSSLALGPLIRGATEMVGGETLAAGAGAIANFIAEHLTDHSERLATALQKANARAWKALEVALAGESFWERCQLALTRAEDKAFRNQVRAFLNAVPAVELPGDAAAFRQNCLQELRDAKRRGLLKGAVDPLPLAEQTAALARFDDPQGLLDAEHKLLASLALELRQAGCAHLGKLLALRPAGGTPLLPMAARYFFRRAVEEDAKLARGLAFAKMEKLGQAQEAGFAGLAKAFAEQGERLEGLLDEVRGVVVQTHGAVLDLQSQMQGQGEQIKQIGDAVLKLLASRQLQQRELRSGDSMSIRDDGERRLLKQVVQQYRALPEKQRRQAPALLNAVGKLEVVAGDFAAAQRDFQELAGIVDDPAARAEAHANRYRAALERRAWSEALAALQEAAQLDPERFAPFPLAKFEPLQILGAGGFGVAFLCRNRLSGSKVVIKTLHQEGLARGLDDVFREARVLEELDHPAIIRLRDCDYADAGRTRPYLVMDYFEGATLAEHVEKNGPVSAAVLVALARRVAEGLRAAHGKGVLHRDVKPGNLLVRRDGATWQVKLIDFGLALEPITLHSTVKSASANPATLTGSSIAGTVDYAAPEQMGRLKDVPVDTYSDVYGFAKTCCYALFKTPQPTFQHWQKLPAPLAELLGRCLAEAPQERPADFAEVLKQLQALAPARVAQPAKPSSPSPPAEPVVVAKALPKVLPAVRPVEPPRRRQRDEDYDRPRPRGRSAWPWLLVVALLVGTPIVLVFSSCMGWWSPFQGGGPGGLSALPTKPLPPAVPLSKEELSTALNDLKGGDNEARTTAARRFAVTPVPQGFWSGKDTDGGIREALEATLGSKDVNARIGAAQALATWAPATWGTSESVPALIPLASEFDGNVRAAVMDTLATLKDKRGAPAVAARLKDPWDRGHGAVEALIKMGPVAEKAVLEYTHEDKDPATRQAAIGVLANIGMFDSRDALETLSKSQNLLIARAAEQALPAIRARVDALDRKMTDEKNKTDLKKSAPPN